ncbi:DUF4355 domain-containing protein [Flavicella sediminum]|uniref:DUF4355 domain-containing protein n=1 Tax=Flavicella sediminum TaxID=2585141 RepID=UPI001123871C|nr:DUF4355 domain-containing protein [Flavicella sediminum]
MNPELLAALSAALLSAGLTEDSEEFKAVIAEPFKGISDKLELKLPTTLDEVLQNPNFKSEFDRKVTAATQKREDNLKDQWDFVEKGKAPKEETPLEKKVREMEETNKKRDAAEALSKKTKTAEKLLEGKKIPKAFIKHFDFESETSLEDQIEGVESVFTEVKQGIVASSGVGGPFPMGGSGEGASEQELADIVDDL